MICIYAHRGTDPKGDYRVDEVRCEDLPSAEKRIEELKQDPMIQAMTVWSLTQEVFKVYSLAREGESWKYS